MTRLKSLLRINPIIVKEIRSRMRGPRAFITLTVMLVAMGGLMYGLLQIILASARYTNILSPQVGQALFASLVFLLLFMIAAVTPAVTAGAISGEKEKQTYEMLMSTPLSPSSILWGKLVSALSYVLLLLFAAIPLASVVFIFGGVALRDMIKALIVLLVIAAAYGVLGLFFSALLGRTGRATVASFLTVIILMIGPIFVAGLVGVLRGGEPPRWILAPSPISGLSAALASSMGTGAGGELFYLLGGIFNMGVTPISVNGIPRPLYHFTIPFYLVLSLVLYLLSTRLVQPARRWKMSKKQVFIGVGIVLLVVGAIAGAFWATAPRYEWAKSSQQADPLLNPMAPVQVVPGVMTEKEVDVVPGSTPTPTPIDPSKEGVSGVSLSEEDYAQIYAAIARQLYTVDHTYGDKSPNWPNLYLVAVPAVQGESGDRLSDQITEDVTQQLGDLPAMITWVSSQDDAIKAPESGILIDEGKGAIITFGSIATQEDGTVQAPASLYFANLGTTGKTYVLSKIDGVWQVTGTLDVKWIN